jgi:hypothetical protein
MALPALQLGILCGPEKSAEFIKDDYFVECGSGDTYDNNYGPLCFSSIPVPDVKSASSSETTVIMTDYRWSQSAPNQCYTFEETE